MFSLLSFLSSEGGEEVPCGRSSLACLGQILVFQPDNDVQSLLFYNLTLLLKSVQSFKPFHALLGTFCLNMQHFQHFTSRAC